jgi:hypothetical protein
MVNCTYKGPGKNKANFGQAGGEASPTALSFGRIVPNEPNLVHEALWHRHPADDPWAGCPCHQFGEMANYAKETQSADPCPGGRRPGDLTGGAFSRADCAKQTQFAFERNEGQVLWGKGVMVNCTYKGPWKNKANSRWTGRDLMHGRSGVVQTKPIARSGAPRWCPAGEPGGVTNGVVVRANCAKRTQFGPAWVP